MEIIPNFSEKALEQMHEQLKVKELVDVEFTIGNTSKIVVAHRIILAAASEFFWKLFESKLGDIPLRVNIKDMEADIFEMFINYCYTGEIDVDEQNVNKVLKAASSLQMPDVAKLCANLIRKNMRTNDNWLDVLQTDFDYESLRDDALRHAIDNFSVISQNKRFLDISAELLLEIIESNQLNVASERGVFEVIKRWYEHDEVLRVQYLPTLIGAIRLTELEPAFVLEFIQPLPGCSQIAVDVLQWFHMPQNREHSPLKHKQPRQYVSTNICEIDFSKLKS